MKSNPLLNGICLVLFVFASVSWFAYRDYVQAQDPNTEKLKKARQDATAVFLDSNQAKEKRLEAAKDLGYPDDETFPKLLSIGADPKQDDDIRWEALRRHPVDERYLNTVLKILGDPNDGGESLDARLVEDMSRRTTFTPSPEMSQRIQGTLRGLLKDARDPVRLRSFRALVAAHDSVAVSQLSDSLIAKQNVPIPLPDAVELLDLDGSVNHIAALKPYLEHENPKVKGIVVRALAVDPGSRPKIVDMAKNKETPDEIRQQAIRGLARADDEFANYAIKLIEDSTDKLPIRSAAMNALAGRMNYNKVDPGSQVKFAQAVEKLMTDSTPAVDPSGKTKASAQKLHKHMQKSFPEVKKHYEKK